MKYIAKQNKDKIVFVTNITKDGFVKFIKNGREVIVAKNKFDKMYKPILDTHN